MIVYVVELVEEVDPIANATVNFYDAFKDYNRLKALGNYVSISAWDCGEKVRACAAWHDRDHWEIPV